MADVDDDRRGAVAAGKELRHQLDGLLRGGKADAHGRALEQGFEAFERKRQMRAALVVGDGVNFVHDYGVHAAQNGAAFLRRQQDVERFGRGHQNVRRTRQHRAALVHQRVAGAHADANFRHQQAALAGHLQNFAERNFQIFLDVVAEGLERRNVEHFGAVVERAAKRLAHQSVDAGQKRRQRFARAGGRGDEGGMPGEDVRPALFLRLGGRSRSAARNHSRTMGCAQSREFETEAPLSGGFVPGSTAGIL